jgi:hypothetical protein
LRAVRLDHAWGGAHLNIQILTFKLELRPLAYSLSE